MTKWQGTFSRRTVKEFPVHPPPNVTGMPFLSSLETGHQQTRTRASTAVLPNSRNSGEIEKRNDF